MLAEAQQRADAFAERHAGRVAELDGPGLIEAMTELGGLQDARHARRHLRRPALLDRHRRPGPRRALPADPGARDADRDEAPVLRARVGRARRRARRCAARHRGPRLLPPPPAHGPPLPPAPALRARGEDPHREGADLAQRLGPPVRGAGRRARGPARGRRRAGLARGRALAPAPARPRGARARGPARDRRARARPAHPRLRLQHAAGRQDGRRPAAQLPALAGEPQPRQRGLRRVRRGARHGRPQPLRGHAPLVPPEGEAARGRPARRLRPHGGRHGREPARHLARGARAGGGLLLVLLARARQPRPPLLRRALDRRAGAPGQARRGVLRLWLAVRAPVRDAQLDLAPPRRPDARARARPRRARGARRAARASSTWRPR